MGAAYNATICKIGTATTFKGDFYEAIQRNKKEYEQGKLRLRNHFEYNYKVVMKYNPKYAKYIEREKRSLGETSDAFRMSYCVTPETRILTSDLRWIRADSIKVGDKLIEIANPKINANKRRYINKASENYDKAASKVIKTIFTLNTNRNKDSEEIYEGLKGQILLNKLGKIKRKSYHTVNDEYETIFHYNKD